MILLIYEEYDRHVGSSFRKVTSVTRGKVMMVRVSPLCTRISKHRPDLCGGGTELCESVDRSRLMEAQLCVCGLCEVRFISQTLRGGSDRSVSLEPTLMSSMEEN